MIGRKALLFVFAVTMLRPAIAADYRSLGYLYLSPLPGAEYTSPQTTSILVRFQSISPAAVTNLAHFIRVTGAVSGSHTGLTWIAADQRTVILQNSRAFQPYEKVTISLDPQVAPGTPGSISPFEYQFAVSGTMTNTNVTLPPGGTVTARGDNPPNETRERAFDGMVGTKWLDFSVPNGTANFSWIQYLYPGNDTAIAAKYSITSANDAPERDPAAWRFYGVDSAANLVLLDSRSNQVFSSRFQKLEFAIDNTNAWRGYRLEITRVANPSAAGAVQLAELMFLEPVTPPVITARGDNPPSETKEKAFDNTTTTKWLDFIVPNGTGNFTWIQYMYPGIESKTVTQYSISSANAVPERDPADWRFYGVSGAGTLTLLHTCTNQVFTSRFQTRSYPISNTNAYRGYRLEITRIANPSSATCMQLSEIGLGTGGAPAPAMAGTASPLVEPPPVTPSAVPGGNSSSYSLTLAPAHIMPNGVSVPSDFPRVNITINNNPHPDPIFIDNRNGGGRGYNVIFDNSGSPIWYMRVPNERRDMKVQSNGTLTMLAREGGLHFKVYDNHYRWITNYAAVNGYSTDDHELQILPDGSFYLLGLRSEIVDMSRFVSGGNPAANVTEEVLQGFSSAGELIFQWRAWDYFDVRDQQSFINILGSNFDFPHPNAIDVDTDGHLLLSSRNTSEITKINRDTGEIIWRLGGVRNQFTFINDPLNGQRNQHAIRMVGTNRYTLFDNGNLHSPQVSRAVEYLIDPVNKTATLVWQYPDPPTSSLFSHYMANAQRLSNGNTLINWAVSSLPKLTEVRSDGTKAFEMNWVDKWETYRTWRCSWQGYALEPYLLVEPYPDNVTLIFNQFGDTNVAYYKIYGGPTPQPTNLLATSSATLKKFTHLPNGPTYFRVSAVNKQGVEGPLSNETNATVNLISPGQNMVSNSDFAQGKTGWTFNLSGGATASWAIENGVARVYLTNGTAALANVQLKQTGKALVQGKKYVFEFDAWSTQPRYIEARIAQDTTPNQNYSGTTSTYLTPVKNRFRYVFTMASVTDLNASVFFNLGASAAGVFIDNVSLFYTASGDFNLDGQNNGTDLKTLTQDWLKQQPGLTGDLDSSGSVDFKDFRIFGENWSLP